MSEWTGNEAPVWKIALGVALGIVLAGVLTFFVRIWLAQQAIEQFNKSAQEVIAQQQLATRRMIEKSNAEQIERVRATAEREVMARAQLAQQKREAAEAQQVSIDEQTRHEAAWAKFYKKPARCDNPPSNEALVQCANEHIRAKRAFEAAYAAGKL